MLFDFWRSRWSWKQTTKTWSTSPNLRKKQRELLYRLILSSTAWQHSHCTSMSLKKSNKSNNLHATTWCNQAHDHCIKRLHSKGLRGCDIECWQSRWSICCTWINNTSWKSKTHQCGRDPLVSQNFRLQLLLNSFMTRTVIIQKPVHWFSLQINGLLFIW